MEEIDNNLIDNKIEELKNDIENEREQKFVNLITEIIVSITLKQLYEEGD